MRFQRCGEYDIHFRAIQPNKGSSDAGELLVYFPRSGECYRMMVVLVPGLYLTYSPDFDPHARLYGKHDFRYSISGAKLCVNILGYNAELVEHLLQTGVLRQCFEKCDPPPGRWTDQDARWDKIQLMNELLPPQLLAYCAALREVLHCGYVICRRYAVAEGAIEDCVLWEKGVPGWSAPFLFADIFRHPVIRTDFDIQGLDENYVIDPFNWNTYSRFTCAGYLAQVLATGTAYPTFSDSHCFELAKAVSDEFVGKTGPWVLHGSHMELSYNGGGGGIVAHTWVLIDVTTRRLTIFMSSDCD